jgi:hypothetical protein
MIAIVSNGRLPVCTDARTPAFATSGHGAVGRIDDARGQLPVAHSLALVVAWIGRLLERRRHAEIARRNSPLSLDDAWVGGWYGRSHMLQEALLQQRCSTRAEPAPRRLDWDDKLD